MKSKDIYPGIVFIILSIFLYFQTLSFPNKTSADDVGAAFWPRVLLLIIIILSILLIILAIKNRKIQSEDNKDNVIFEKVKFYLKPIAGIAFCFLFFLLFKVIGFFIMTFVLYITLALLITKSYKKVWLTLIEAAVIVTICYVVFDSILKVNLPQGIFFI